MEFEIDNLLNEKGEFPSQSFHADTACSRGRVAEQILTRVVDGVYLPDVRPLDTLYFKYELGARGMLWGSVESVRSKANINDSYPEAKFVGKEGTVQDFWNKKENIIYIDDKEVRRLPIKGVLGYDLGKPPFILQVVPAGSVLKDKDNLKHTGESIYEMLRGVFPEKNFLASTFKTHTYGLFEPAVQIYDKEHGAGATPPDEYVGSPGSQTMVDAPGAIQPVSTPDIKRSTMQYLQMVNDEIVKAGYSAMDFGQPEWPLSFIAMAKLAKNKGELLLPRLQALTLLAQARYRMIIEQFLLINETLELGELGHRRKYSPEQLRGAYTIKFHFFITSKEEMAVNSTIAEAIRKDVSSDYIRREIYKLSNPDGERTKQRAEQAEQLDPAILLFNQGHSLIDARRDIEAELVLQRLESMLRQRRIPVFQGQVEGEPKAPERTVGKQLMPLFSGGGGGRGTPPTEGEE